MINTELIKIEPNDKKDLLKYFEYFQEVLKVYAEIKPISRFSIRLGNEESVRNFIDLINRLGLQVNIVSEAKGKIVYICKNKAYFRELCRADELRDSKKVGECLGYPRCCVEYSDNLFQNNDYDRISTLPYSYENNYCQHYYGTNNIYNSQSYSDSLSKSKIVLYQNKGIFFHRIFFIEHIPCSYDCVASRELAQKTEKIVAIVYPKIYKVFKSLLRKGFLVFGSLEFVVINYEIINTTVSFAVFDKSPLMKKSVLNVIAQAQYFVISDYMSIDLYGGKKLIKKIKCRVILFE